MNDGMMKSAPFYQKLPLTSNQAAIILDHHQLKTTVASGGVP
jgi:hypothetical protein